MVSMLVTESSREWTLTLRHTGSLLWFVLFSLHSGCVAGRRGPTNLSAADGEPTGGRGDLGLETNIHDLHGASASGWTEAILRFKASQNWGLERCKTQDVCNQKDWRISPGEKKPLKSQLLSFRGDSADRLHRERERCCQRRRYCLSDSVDLGSPSSREGFFPSPSISPPQTLSCWQTRWRQLLHIYQSPMLMCAPAGTYLCFPALLLRAAYFRFY